MPKIIKTIVDFITFFSLILYIGTFIVGFLLDRHPERKTRARNIFIIWVYIFLCFGYMCGSDWDHYELIYTKGLDLESYLHEPFSYVLFSALPTIIPDFWVFCGIAKCVYLYTLIKLLQCLTPKWMSTLSFLMPFSLLFMLISNPLRYMLGLCSINIALVLLYKGLNHIENINFLWLKVIGLVIIATCFQNTCIVFLPLLPLFSLYEKMYKLNRVAIFITYLIVIYITSDLALFSYVTSFNAYLSILFGITDYTGYYVLDDSSSLLSLGNLFRTFFLFVVLISRDKVVAKHPNGAFIYSVSILVLFLLRFFILIPTAFRWAIPFEYFLIVYFVTCLSIRIKWARVILLYSMFLLCKSLWFSPAFIPYTNSIPYILTGHLDYLERLEYNKKAGKARTGITFEDSAYEQYAN